MSSNLMLIKLLDGTVIFARENRIDSGRIVVKNLKMKKDGEIPRFINDEMNISEDAIEVWFRVLKGGKEPVIKSSPGLSAPDPSPAA